MSIKGFMKMSMLDWPGYLTSVIFLGNCAFKCAYCHNKQLAWTPEVLEDYPLEKISKYLFKNSKWIDGITITGGEPTESPEILFELIADFKSKKIKIDTNGSKPDVIKEIAKKLYPDCGDRIEMDIKAPFSKPNLYKKITGGMADVEKLKKTFLMLRESKLGMFRTVNHPLLDWNDLNEIKEMVGGFPYRVSEYYDIYSVDKREGK